MEAEEQFKQLDLSNAFLFSLAFSDPEACALVLQVILQKPVYKVMVQPRYSAGALISNRYQGSSSRFSAFSSPWRMAR